MVRFARIRTKNATARPLRRSILVNKRAVVRLGSRTPIRDIFPNYSGEIIEINSIDAINNSRDKLRMKECFAKLKVPQAEHWTFYNLGDIGDLPYPIVLKRICGFQGKGMELFEDSKQFIQWLERHSNTEGWYIEKFYNYAREYRLHVARDEGVFLSWRKLRTKEAAERWFFNSRNSTWIGSNHEKFDKPTCWDAMATAAINALNSTGLDIGAVDIRVQSSKQKSPDFIVCEINSAPALGEEGIIRYREVIKKLIERK